MEIQNKENHWIQTHFGSILVILFLFVIVSTMWYMNEKTEPTEIYDQLDDSIIKRVQTTNIESPGEMFNLYYETMQVKHRPVSQKNKKLYKCMTIVSL